MDSMDSINITSQLQNLKNEKDQIFQQYIETNAQYTLNFIDKKTYASIIHSLQFKLRQLKTQNDQIKFRLQQQFIEHAKLNDHLEWTDQQEKELISMHYFKKSSLRTLALHFIKTPYCIQQKINQLHKFYNSIYIGYDNEIVLEKNHNLYKNDYQALVNFSIQCKRSPNIILDKIKQIEQNKDIQQQLQNITDQTDLFNLQQFNCSANDPILLKSL